MAATPQYYTLRSKTPQGACAPKWPPYWSATASYTARCDNRGSLIWGWMPAGADPISGVVWMRSSPTLDFLVAHDYSADGARRFSILQFVDGVLSENNLVTWVGSTPPNNIEALDRFDDTLFVAVTGEGQLYMVALSANGATISQTANSTLPGYVGGTQIESFAVRLFESFLGDDLFLCMWATRGGPGVPAVISWSSMTSNGVVAAVMGTVNFTTPFPTANQRHVAALRISDAGLIFAASGSDPGDDGPFSSAAYKIGTLTRVGDVGVFSLDAAPTELYRTLNHKAEGIAGVPNDQIELGLILASDDENRGGSIFLQYPPIGRELTISRTVISTISLKDAQLKAQRLAKREAIAELQCMFQSDAYAYPYCAGDYYYYDPVVRTAWSPTSPSDAAAAALAATQEAAAAWCYAGWDQEPPPVISD